MTPIAHLLDRGYALTVTPAADARAVSVVCSEDAAESALIREARTWGPYLVPRTFSVRGDAAATVAASAVGASIGGLLLVSDGAPADAAQATIDVNPTGDDNGLTFTARQYGAGGNEITIAYIDPGANDAALSVTVAGNAIRVSLATGEAGAIESTAAEVLAAIQAHGPAHELVTVSLLESDTNFSDGSGAVTAIASTALEGGAGYGIGVARPGALCIDTTNGALYRNGGTRAAPNWTAEVQSGYAAISSIVNGLAALHLYGAGAPVNYTDGDPAATGEGTAPKGALYSDTTNGLVYRNSGTQAQPIWTALADVA